jgi:hypothetical protein
MKTIFIIIKNDKFEHILKYSNFVHKDTEKYFILCTSNITNEIKESFKEKNCTFFRNTLSSSHLSSPENSTSIFNTNSIYTSMLFAQKIIERNHDESSNIILFSKIQNAEDICSFKYLFKNYLNIKYLYIR